MTSASPSTTTTTVFTIVTYTCHEGHRFENNEKQTNIVCLADLTWNKTLLHCKGNKCSMFKIHAPHMPKALQHGHIDIHSSIQYPGT